MPVPFSPDALLVGGNWALKTRLGRVDVMQRVPGVDGYEQLHAGAVAAELPELGGTIWIAGRDDLLAMKRAAGRPQDLIDIQALVMAEGRSE